MNHFGLSGSGKWISIKYLLIDERQVFQKVIITYVCLL